MGNITYRQGHEITGRQELVRLDQLYWIARGPNKEKDFRYTFADEEDFNAKIERAPCGFAAAYLDDKPISIIKVMRIATSGDKERIPPTSDELTGGGKWSTFDPAGDTTVLTTFSVEHDVRDYTVDSENLTDAVFDGFVSMYSGTEYRISYTPLVGSGLRLHWRHGAKPVAFFKHARPWLQKPARPIPGIILSPEDVEHVVIWGYNWPSYDQQLLDHISSMFKLC